jgi:hypothetical protein
VRWREVLILMAVVVVVVVVVVIVVAPCMTPPWVWAPTQ